MCFLFLSTIFWPTSPRRAPWQRNVLSIVDSRTSIIIIDNSISIIRIISTIIDIINNIINLFRIIRIIRIIIITTTSFHNFKSQKFKLSVSNPKSQYAAYLSVLSQFSNCQSLGRKNKHEILKTDRTTNLRTKILDFRVFDSNMISIRFKDWNSHVHE